MGAKSAGMYALFFVIILLACYTLTVLNTPSILGTAGNVFSTAGVCSTISAEESTLPLYKAYEIPNTNVVVTLPQVIDSPEKLKSALKRFLEAYIQCVKTDHVEDFVKVFGDKYLKRYYAGEILNFTIADITNLNSEDLKILSDSVEVFSINSNIKFLKVILSNVDDLVDHVQKLGFGNETIDFYVNDDLYAYIVMSHDSVFFGISPVKMYILFGVGVTINKEADPPIVLCSDRTGWIGSRYIIVKAVKITKDDAIKTAIKVVKEHYNSPEIRAVVDNGVVYDVKYTDENGRGVLYPKYLLHLFAKGEKGFYLVEIWSDDGSIANIYKTGFMGGGYFVDPNSDWPENKVAVIDFHSGEIKWLYLGNDKNTNGVLHLVLLVLGGVIGIGIITAIVIKRRF